MINLGVHNAQVAGILQRARVGSLVPAERLAHPFECQDNRQGSLALRQLLEAPCGGRMLGCPLQVVDLKPDPRADGLRVGANCQHLKLCTGCSGRDGFLRVPKSLDDVAEFESSLRCVDESKAGPGIELKRAFRGTKTSAPVSNLRKQGAEVAPKSYLASDLANPTGKGNSAD